MKKIYIEENSYILYNEENITISVGETKRQICNEYCSDPILNRNNMKIIYISPFEWEMIGKLMMYDIRNEKLTKIEIEEIQEGHTIKKIQWLDDNKIAMIVGFANGTITVGGDLYTYDLNTKEYICIYSPPKAEEVKQFSLKDNTIEMEIVVFDKNFNSYKIRKEKIKIKDIEVDKC